MMLYKPYGRFRNSANERVASFILMTINTSDEFTEEEKKRLKDEAFRLYRAEPIKEMIFIGITFNTLRGIICPKKKLYPKMYSRTVMRIKKWLEIRNDAL